MPRLLSALLVDLVCCSLKKM